MVKEGYKLTEIGVIPEDWEVKKFNDIAKITMGHSPSSCFYNLNENGLPLIQGNADIEKRKTIIRNYTSQITKKANKGDLILSVRAPVGEVAKATFDCCIGRGVCAISYKNDYLYQYLIYFESEWSKYTKGSTFDSVTSSEIKNLKIPIPPKPEQKAIAQALSDIDGLITSLETLIKKKEHIKTATMQQLLTGKKRLNGFSGEWVERKLGEVALDLDNLRVPLNENQRNSMKGDIPYCGANGVVGYINDYIIDDDIILIAEDGGYFDEYATRPIAYRMIGKVWVNNHAHILKAKIFFNQDYLFYSLVHKDITKFLASGTRAKLNKSEMYKIIIFSPKDKKEQQAIAQILSDMDKEIEALKTKLEKTKAIKRGMMQELLTGRIRLMKKDNHDT